MRAEGPDEPVHQSYGVAMLDYIRSNAQSWGVKAAFGVIILVFVFWGVGSLRDSNTPGVVATVNGKPILVLEMENALRQAEDSLRRTNPEITTEQLRQMQLTRQILQQLVIESALLQEAARLDITISPVDMRRAVEAMPIFQNDKGKFDPEVYKRIMTAQRQSLSAFEEGIRKRLLEEKLRKDITVGATVTMDEARAFFNYAQEQREVEYIFFPASASPAAAPAEDELKAYYESHRQAFAIPVKMNVEYILAHPADLGQPESFSAEVVQAWYDKNTDKFSTPAKAKVRHILLRIAPDASPADIKKADDSMKDIVVQLTKGGDFAALAAKYSQDDGSAKNGGSLDWIAVGDTVQPFNDAIFAGAGMKSGEVSKPVRTDFGLHLIKVDEMQPAVTRALKDVEKDVRATLAEQQGAEKIRETLDLVIEANILGKPLPEVAKTHGLTAKTTGLLSQPELEKTLGIDAKTAQTLMATPAGSPVDTALESAGNGFVVARVKEKTPAATRPYEEVKADIVKIITAEKSRQNALKAAADARKALGEKGEATLPADLASKVVSTPAVQRGAPLGELVVQPDALQAVFAAQPQQWLPSVYEGSVKGANGAVMLRVKKTILPDEALWQPLSEMLRASLDESRRQEMFQAFVSVLLQKAKIEIKNPTYLEQRGGN